MGRKCETSLYDYCMHTLYATYHTTNDDTMVEIIEPLSEQSEIWIVQNCDTEMFFLAHRSQLDDIHYYV
mgnify:FL=1